MKQKIEDGILALLSAAPSGLSAPELRALLARRISQPTLWRYLDALRAGGFVTVEGRARATRYHAAMRTGLAALRSRRLHESVAHRLARDPALRDIARSRLRKLRDVNPHGRLYHDRWEELLDSPLPILLRALTEDSEQADSLRRESPFTVLVEPAQRRSVFETLRAD